MTTIRFETLAWLRRAVEEQVKEIEVILCCAEDVQIAGLTETSEVLKTSEVW